MVHREFSPVDANESDFSQEEVSADDVLGPFPDDLLVDPMALGILRCLRMLATEAAGLGLRTTATALSHSIEICAADQSPSGSVTNVRMIGNMPGSTRLH